MAELAAEQLDEAGPLPLGEVTDGLGRADAGDGEQPAGFDGADLRHCDEQVEDLGAGEVVGRSGEDLLEADLAFTQILLEFGPQPANVVGLP
jgi:hypothetical protein